MSEPKPIESVRVIPPNSKLIEAIADGLDTIYTLAGWHADDEADPNNRSPEDAHAHVNGLIRHEVLKLQELAARIRERKKESCKKSETNVGVDE